MKAASRSGNHPVIRTIYISALCLLISLISIQLVHADGAPPPDPTVGGVGPYQPQKTNVQMMSETVYIEVPPSPSNVDEPKQIRVNASFKMQNQGSSAEQMDVIFPLTRLGYGGSMEQALYEVDKSSFVAKADGTSLPISEITTPPEIISSDLEHGFPLEVQWAAFPVNFPAKQEVILQVEYKMLNPYGVYGEGFTGIAYILETGAGWYGNIQSADIILRLPYPVTEEAISQANSGYIISGNELQWKFTNFEPTRQDNIEVGVINADLWKSILDLRTRVNQNPDDVDAWVDLGDKYMMLGIYMRDAFIIEVDQHFAELALAARQEAVRLRPESGDAHYKLAEILWLSNPGVKNDLRQGGESTAPQPSLDDPSIRQILDELQLSWSLGGTGNLPYINKVFPELILAPPTTISNTASPTVNPAPTLTRIISPTAYPTSTSAPVPDSNPAETFTRIPYGIFIAAALVLAIIFGVFGYRWKSMS